ncbi:MAG: LamB/YcsF family protein [Chitinophagaceae bacterium]|nr:LamB/YcsF family protein [Chitinophagaceae bacterium]
MKIDINCDMGEGIGPEEKIMPYISSASISCGFHAGNEEIILHTLKLCKTFRVKAGAHPSFPDREHFGRKEMHFTETEIYQLVKTQLQYIHRLAETLHLPLHHVKPHGALYNLSASDPVVAGAIAEAVRDFDSSLIIYGLSGSHSLNEARKMGLKTASEVFADRVYNDDGRLLPRTTPGSVIENISVMKKQVSEMIHENQVTTCSGKIIPVLAETICIHSDGKNAVEFAIALNKMLNETGKN